MQTGTGALAGWLLQLVGLVVVGSALLVGLIYDQIRLEVAMLGAGSVVFLLGRWLLGRSGA